MPVCAFQAPVAAGGTAVSVNGVSGGLLVALSGSANGSVACDYVLLTNAEYDQISHAVLVSAAPSPIDPAVASGYFGFGCSMVIGCYLIAHKVGLLLNFVRRG